MFREWLQMYFPDRAARVMNLIRQCRCGNDYRCEFGERMVGTGPFSARLIQRWRVAIGQLGFSDSSSHSYKLDCSQFQRSQKQMVLF